MNLFVSYPSKYFEFFKKAVDAYMEDITIVEDEYCAKSIHYIAIFINNIDISDILLINAFDFFRNYEHSLSTTSKLCTICFSILSMYV